MREIGGGAGCADGAGGLIGGGAGEVPGGELMEGGLITGGSLGLLVFGGKEERRGDGDGGSGCFNDDVVGKVEGLTVRTDEAGGPGDAILGVDDAKLDDKGEEGGLGGGNELSLVTGVEGGEMGPLVAGGGVVVFLDVEEGFGPESFGFFGK